MAARLRPFMGRSNRRPDPRLMVLAASWKTPIFNRVDIIDNYSPGASRPSTIV